MSEKHQASPKEKIGHPVTWIEKFAKKDIERILRISVTDSCDYNCFFCHNEGQGGKNNIGCEMSPAEIRDIIVIANKCGIRKFKLTGGEPLLYIQNNQDIIEVLNEVFKRLDKEHIDISIITNGYLLGEFAQRVKKAGINRITISLPTLDINLMKKFINPHAKPNHIEQVLASIKTAVEVGIDPVKVNFTLFYSFEKKEGNLYEIGEIIKKCKELKVKELRFHTLLWHPGFDEFDGYYFYWNREILKIIKEQFKAVCENSSLLIEELLYDDLLVYSDKAPALLYPRTRKFYSLAEPFSVVFEPMKFKRYSGSAYCTNCRYKDKCQEGAYSLRVAADGRITGCLLGEESMNILEKIRSGLPEAKLIESFKEAFKLLPK